jgi:oxaloacetate decarboxylase gamma subunit
MSDMLMSGLELMVLGMGIVFVFLAVLIVAMQGMSRLAARLQPEPPPQAVRAPVHVSTGHAPNARLIAAISAAISRYRASHRA